MTTEEDGRRAILAAEAEYDQAIARWGAAREAGEPSERVAELRAEMEAADDAMTDAQDGHPLAWSDLEFDRAYEAQEESIYGTPAEQAADAAIDEAESIVSAELDRYAAEEIPGPEPPEPEAGD